MSDTEISKRFLSVQKSARILVYGDPAKMKNIWICFHGYSQQVESFAKPLKALKNENNAVIIPEALNRFYIAGSTGNVGASWMTREERDSDIADNIAYIDELCDKMLSDNVKISVLGFSQGAATAVRWACRGKFEIKKLVLWAGAVPPDLNLVHDIPKLRKIELILVLGNNDEYLAESDVTKMSDHWSDLGLPFELIRFEGGHSLKSGILKDLSLNEGIDN